MKLAVDTALKEMKEDNGGPFGAVIVRRNEVVASMGNKVVKDTDPTAHAELLAVREACKKLNTLDLSDCIMYTTCAPCPMCMGALLWSGLKKIYYASSHDVATAQGFSSKHLQDYLDGSDKTIAEVIQVEDEQRYSYLWTDFSLLKD
ncbi:nucleoside deaminase [Enterococcus silesiacus]|nr:nucleoside deaminase [Enterococcus silesiacus]